MMKAIVFSTVFVLIGALSLTVSACENNARAAGEHHQMTMSHEHSGHGTHQMKDGEKAKNGFDSMPAPGTKAFCPVMKNEFEVKKDSPYSVYKGKTYVFCCAGCKPMFDENPEKYLKR
jgi:YHS domain-containing protein